MPMMTDRPASTSTLLTVASGQLFSTSIIPTAVGNITKIFDVDSALTDTSISGAYIDEIYLQYGKTVNIYIDAQSVSSGTYSQTGTTVVVTAAAGHNLLIGDKVYLNYTSGTGVTETLTVTSLTSTTFTGTSASTLTTAGNVNYYPPLDIGFYATTSSSVTNTNQLFPLFTSHIAATWENQSYSLTLAQDLPFINHPVVQSGSDNVLSTNRGIAPKLLGLMLPRGSAIYAAVSGTISLTTGFYVNVQAGYY
jgi:hypothetical protein